MLFLFGVMPDGRALASAILKTDSPGRACLHLLSGPAKKGPYLSISARSLTFMRPDGNDINAWIKETICLGWHRDRTSVNGAHGPLARQSKRDASDAWVMGKGNTWMEI